MANYAQNAAYDLALFEKKRAEVVALKPNKKQQKSNSRRAKLHAVLTVVVYISIALVALGIVGFLITSNVQLTELNSKIAESQTTLAELQSEEVRLKSELASKTSIANVNAYAAENGMTATDSTQVSYLTITGSDTVTVSGGASNFFAQLWHAIIGIFS